MTNVIEILARAGSTGAVDVDGLAPELRAAVLGGDPLQIARLAGIRPIRACMVVAPDNEPGSEEVPDERPVEDEPQPDADAA